MISREDITRVYIDGRDEYYRNRRINLRGMYKGEDRPEMLKDLIVNGGFFSTSKPGDVEFDSRRNFVIEMMDSMGFLDEDNLTRIIEFMLYELPIIPNRTEKEIKEFGNKYCVNLLTASTVKEE